MSEATCGTGFTRVSLRSPGLRRRIDRSCRNVLRRCCHQPPQHAEDEEIVAPVIDVDDQALADHPYIGGIEGLVERLPGRAREQETRAHRNREDGKREIAETRKPAAGQERVEKGVM